MQSVTRNRRHHARDIDKVAALGGRKKTIVYALLLAVAFAVGLLSPSLLGH